MDKLKLAFTIIMRKVKEKRGTGEVPVYLGPQGMLALMHDRIAKYMRTEDATEHVLDLAVMAVFAFSTVLPEMEFDDEESFDDEEAADGRMGESSEGNDREPTVPTDNEEVSTDPRWSPVHPGDPVPRATKVEEEEPTDEDS